MIVDPDVKNPRAKRVVVNPSIVSLTVIITRYSFKSSFISQAFFAAVVVYIRVISSLRECREIGIKTKNYMHLFSISTDVVFHNRKTLIKNRKWSSVSTLWWEEHDSLVFFYVLLAMQSMEDAFLCCSFVMKWLVVIIITRWCCSNKISNSIDDFTWISFNTSTFISRETFNQMRCKVDCNRSTRGKKKKPLCQSRQHKGSRVSTTKMNKLREVIIITTSDDGRASSLPALVIDSFKFAVICEYLLHEKA